MHYRGACYYTVTVSLPTEDGQNTLMKISRNKFCIVHWVAALVRDCMQWDMPTPLNTRGFVRCFRTKIFGSNVWENYFCMYFLNLYMESVRLRCYFTAIQKSATVVFEHFAVSLLKTPKFLLHVCQISEVIATVTIKQKVALEYTEALQRSIKVLFW